MTSPIIIGALWMTVSGIESWANYFLFGICLVATVFRSIKVGFLKN